MKKVEFFYLTYCPHCKKAFRLIEEVQAENPEYRDITITQIDEAKNETLSNSRDYYYVPCFYVDNEKIHEGTIEKKDVERVFQCAIEK